MFQDNLAYSVATFCVGGYLFYMWCSDCAHYASRGFDRKGAFPGARPVSAKFVFFAAVAALVLLGIQMSGESALGVVGEQTRVGAFAIFSWIAAAFIEELVFRGYLVIDGKGTAWLIAGAVFFSLIFALAHPFLWDYKVAEGASWLAGEWIWDFSVKSFYSTLCVFECSLLFYYLRFAPQNRDRSLLPCVAAHFAYNAGVFVAKAFQGFVEWTF